MIIFVAQVKRLLFNRIIPVILFFAFCNTNLTSSYAQGCLKFQLESGAAFSLTQQGISPLAPLRRWYDRGILSPYVGLNFCYQFKNFEIATGARLLEKGFKTKLIIDLPPVYYEEYYQYRLAYIEMPLMVGYHVKSWQLAGGIFAAYLYDDTWLYSNRDEVQSNPVSYHEIYAAKQYSRPNRFNSWDVGLCVAVDKALTKQLSFTFKLQRGFIDVDNWQSVDLMYNASALLGLKLNVLGSGK